MGPADQRPVWATDGRDWPNREHSRFIASSGLTWHVQHWGEGPRLLLLHGTGAATHSFRDLAPALAAHFQVLVPDLPGHGFTGMPAGDGLSLRGMARLMGGLLKQFSFEPDVVVGHSAGAAILVEMVLQGLIRPRAIIALNGALRPMRGASIFSPLAKLLFVNPLAPRLFAWRAAGPDATRRLLEGTGSTLDRRGIELYQRLFRKPGHVAGTLGMMANWDLDRLERSLPRMTVPLVLVTGEHDRAIPPSDARVIAARLRSARVMPLGYGGHLVHEESPDRVAQLITDLSGDMIPATIQTLCLSKLHD
jgi:magnesium chelatase accessory protein